MEAPTPGLIERLRLEPLVRDALWSGTELVLWWRDGTRSVCSRDAHGRWWIDHLGTSHTTRGVVSRRERSLGAVLAGGPRPTGDVVAPTGGRVTVVEGVAGGSVATGERLVVIEAMKMSFEVRATRGGTIAFVRVVPGQLVERGQILVRVE